MQRPSGIRPRRLALISSALAFALLAVSAAPTLACTSFCMDGPDGSVFGANLDLTLGDGFVFVNRRGIAKENIRRNSKGETARWVSEYGSVTFNLAGRGFVWSGMNEAGLVVSTMELLASEYPPPDERPPFDTGFWLQYLLDTCGSVEEVIEASSHARPEEDSDSMSHFLIADAGGDCAAIEYLDGRMVVHTGETLPVRALANAPYVAGIAFLEQGIVPPDNPGKSVERVAGAVERIRAFRPDGDVSAVAYSLDILTETVVAPKAFWSDWFGEPYTRWSVAYDIARRSAHFRSVASPTVKHFALDAFDFSCDAPLQMLDVNIGIEGNVESAFQPYDSDLNLKTFRKFCDRWGIEVSAEGAEGLMHHLESFECAR